MGWVMDILRLLQEKAQVCPQKTALLYEGKEYSFTALRDSAFTLANYLVETVYLNKSEKVALFLPNTFETIISFLGVFSAGGCVIPLDYMLIENEIVHFLNHCQAKVLIFQPRKDVNIEKIKAQCPYLKEIIVYATDEVKEYRSWQQLFKTVNNNIPKVSFSPANTAAIFYTSGSTGQPKGVMLSYAHLDNPTKTIDYFLNVTNKDVFLCGGVPFSHLGGLNYILLMLQFGAKLVLLARFHPFEFINTIAQHKITIFCIVPAMYVAILSLKDYTKFDLSSLRFAVVFGAPSSPVLLEQFHKICPNAQLSNGWGMTETAAPNCMLPPGEKDIASIGKFVPWMQARVVDENGNSLGVNVKGELWVKGEALMQGYFKETELTKESMTNDQWLKTGDIAYYNDKGMFYIAGRKKDMLKVAGEIVFPHEVEEKIQHYPKVKEAAVIGVEDKLRGEVPKAFIAPKENEVINLDELKEFLKQNLAHFKIPHYFEFVNELPKNRTGKIDKQKLKEDKL